MDILTMRILDALIDDEEQLEEVFVGVNFERQDRVFRLYREQYRLADIVVRLRELERQGLVVAKPHAEYPESCGVAANLYRLTEEGVRAWKEKVTEASSLYEKID